MSRFHWTHGPDLRIVDAMTTSTLWNTVKDELRERREGREALNRLRADLQHYRTPSDIDDLLASVDSEDTPEAEMIRSILSENLRGYHAPRSASRAASVARPRPQAERASRHPTSTQGVKGRSYRGTARPVNPMSSPVSSRSRAHRPHPCASSAAFIRSSMASACSRVSGSGK